MKPIEGSFPSYFTNYIKLVNENNVLEALAHQQPVFVEFFDAIPAEKSDYSYAPGKWTLKELLQHMIDTERIFAYRALCVARKETQSLPGFNENEFVLQSHANKRVWTEMLSELKLVRQTTEILFRSFSLEVYGHIGLSSNKPVTVSALGFIIVGHVYHHINIIKERYL